MEIFARYPDKWTSYCVIYTMTDGTRYGSPEWENCTFAVDFYNQCKEYPNVISAQIRKSKTKARTICRYKGSVKNEDR